MALGVENYRLIYVADGVDDTFAITDEFFSDPDNIKVYLRDESVSPPSVTLQTDGVDYDVVGTDVVFDTAPANGLKVCIFREMPLEQILDLIASGLLPVEALELQLDRIVAMAQQLNGMVARALKVNKTSANLDLELPEPEPLLFLRWNAAGTALENIASGSGGGIGAQVFGEAPVGAINNANVNFVLAHAPLAGSLRVFKNGGRTMAFSFVGTALTMDDPVGFAGELICDYEY